MFPSRAIHAAVILLIAGCAVDAFQSIAPLQNPFVPRTTLTTTTTTTSATITKRGWQLFMARMQPRRPRGRQAPVKEDVPTMNDEIQAPELRVVAPTPGGKDESFGIMSRADALTKAQEMGGLDLILINEKSDPPVCKIVDYSKFRYMQEKKAKEVRKNSKASELKEVKMSYKIDVHDYDVRKKNALKFLRQGNRVKCTVMFRGREVQHDNLGYDLLNKLGEDLSSIAVRENNAKREGRNLAVILSPRPEVMKAISDERRAEERLKKKKKKLELELRASAKQEARLAENGEQPKPDDDDDDDDGDDDDDDDMEDSLDALLGGDTMTKDLFN